MRIVLAQCLLSVLSTYCYEPIVPYVNAGAAGPVSYVFGHFPIDEPRYVLIRQDRIAGCRHTFLNNYKLEDHVDIVGVNGTPANPMGIWANWPRYYVKKILLQNWRFKIVALLNPEGQRLGPANDPANGPRFQTQIWSIICKDGIIEFAGRNARVIGGAANPVPYACGIEEQLAEFCLRDGDMGDLLNPYEIFNPRPGLPPEQQNSWQFNEHFARGVVESCNRFVIMWLPTRIELPRRTTPYAKSSEKMQWHLRAAQRANFDRVLLNGIGLARNYGPQGCAPKRVSWETFVLGELIDNEIMRTNLIRRTSSRGLPHEWYLCRTTA